MTQLIQTVPTCQAADCTEPAEDFSRFPPGPLPVAVALCPHHAEIVGWTYDPHERTPA